MKCKFWKLQLFAEAGDVVNVKAGDTNAYTGAVNTTTAFNPLIKEFYDTELLENMRVDCYYAQFAKKQGLPAGSGNKVEWRKWNTFAPANQLQEAVIPTGQKFGMTSISDTVEQYGTYTAISDVLDLQAYNDVQMGATEEMGASAAETQETLIRNDLMTGTNVLYCPNSGGAANTAVGTMSKAYLTPTVVNKAATILKKNKAPTINGKYYAVIHPSVSYNLRESEGWLEAHKYARPEEIFNGEIGELHGVRFIEDSFAPVVEGAADGVAYATFFFGKDSFATIDPEGGALEMIMHDKSEIGGPLNQFSTIGYKFMTNGATILYQERLLRVMSTSDMSGDDEANYTA